MFHQLFDFPASPVCGASDLTTTAGSAAATPVGTPARLACRAPSTQEDAAAMQRQQSGGVRAEAQSPARAGGERARPPNGASSATLSPTAAEPLADFALHELVARVREALEADSASKTEELCRRGDFVGEAILAKVELLHDSFRDDFQRIADKTQSGVGAWQDRIEAQQEHDRRELEAIEAQLRGQLDEQRASLGVLTAAVADLGGLSMKDAAAAPAVGAAGPESGAVRLSSVEAAVEDLRRELGAAQEAGRQQVWLADSAARAREEAQALGDRLTSVEAAVVGLARELGSAREADAEPQMRAVLAEARRVAAEVVQEQVRVLREAAARATDAPRSSGPLEGADAAELSGALGALAERLGRLESEVATADAATREDLPARVEGLSRCVEELLALPRRIDRLSARMDEEVQGLAGLLALPQRIDRLSARMDEEVQGLARLESLELLALPQRIDRLSARLDEELQGLARLELLALPKRVDVLSARLGVELQGRARLELPALPQELLDQLQGVATLEENLSARMEALRAAMAGREPQI